MKIDEFIDIVAPKLPMPKIRVYETVKGSELKLTGVKDVKGKPIDDKKLYKTVEKAEQHVDHKRKLKLAWLRGGKTAVRSYLSKCLKPDDVEKAISVLQDKK